MEVFQWKSRCHSSCFWPKEASSDRAQRKTPMDAFRKRSNNRIMYPLLILNQNRFVPIMIHRALFLMSFVCLLQMASFCWSESMKIFQIHKARTELEEGDVCGQQEALSSSFGWLVVHTMDSIDWEDRNSTWSSHLKLRFKTCESQGSYRRVFKRHFC